MISEALLHYIWQYQLFNSFEFFTAENTPIQLIKQGKINYNEGPDFSDAQIIIDGIKLSGSIEIHCKTSDWELHQHNSNKHYNNVILHVVYENDRAISSNIPILEIKKHIDNSIINRYKILQNNQTPLVCSSLVDTVEKDFKIISFLQRLTFSRLEKKVDEINLFLKKSNNNWEWTALLYIAKYLGGNINKIAFQQIIQSIDFLQLKKIVDKPIAIEAILMGQANLLEKEQDDAYFHQLKKEYYYYKKLFQLQVLPDNHVKFLRLRPVSFPTVRLSQLAKFIHKNPNFFAAIISNHSLVFFQKLLTVSTNPYWEKHFVFDEESTSSTKNIGADTIATIMINAIIPIRFAYAKYTDNEPLQESTLLLLQQLKPEKNKIVNQYKAINLSASNAEESQALIELHQNYCVEKKCLHCAIGKIALQKK